MTGEMTQHYPCAPTSPALARRFCTESLSSLLAGSTRDPAVDELIADAELVVSELVTNAVNAAGTLVELRLSARDGRVRIEVTDDGPGRPRSGDPGPQAAGGRGLMIVATLSQDWGVVGEGRRKRVWAELQVQVVSAA